MNTHRVGHPHTGKSTMWNAAAQPRDAQARTLSKPHRREHPCHAPAEGAHSHKTPTKWNLGHPAGRGCHHGATTTPVASQYIGIYASSRNAGIYASTQHLARQIRSCSQAVFPAGRACHPVATTAPGASQHTGIYASSLKRNTKQGIRTALASLELLTNACLPCALGSNNGSGNATATM